MIFFDSIHVGHANSIALLISLPDIPVEQTMDAYNTRHTGAVEQTMDAYIQVQFCLTAHEPFKVTVYN